MRKQLPIMHESADEGQQRLQRETDGKRRQRLHALSLVARGQAQHRKAMASLFGVPRHSVAAWLAAYAAGGLDQALRSHVPLPPVPRRMTDPP
jgi:hypothetical protein